MLFFGQWIAAEIRRITTAHIYERRKSLDNHELHHIFPSYYFRLHDGPLSCLGIGYDMRTAQELLGHNDIRTTMLYTYVLNRGGKGVRILLEIFT